MMVRIFRGAVIAAVAAATLLGAATARGDELAGKASIGFALGAMRFTGGNDLSSGAAIRPILRATFKYAWENHFVSVLETAYGWNAYGEGGGYTGIDTVGTLAVVTPVTLGLDYRFSSPNPIIVPRFGAGIGIYPTTIRAGRDQISRDNATDRKRQRAPLGFYAKAGTELIATPSMVLNADLLWHYAFAKDEDRFPSGFFNSNMSFAEFRIGLNYYFTIHSTGAAPAKPTESEE